MSGRTVVPKCVGLAVCELEVQRQGCSKVPRNDQTEGHEGQDQKIFEINWFQNIGIPKDPMKAID